MIRLIVPITLYVGILICSSVSVAQTKDEIEKTLKQMGPEQIDQKLKELGLSREEALKRAREQGIDLESYLTTLSVQPTKGQAQQTAVHSIKQEKPTPPVQLETIERSPEAKGTLLPGFTNRIQALGLEPYGYSIFRYPATTFEPVLNIPTPPSYIVGPGDEIIISVWGDTKLYHELTVNREGNLVIPDVGPINVNGLTIKEIREKLLRRMTEVYSSLKHGAKGATSFLDVSLGKLRTIQVFVLGEVSKPGGYSLSSLSTMLHALYLSGGPTTNGSLRKINLLRNNKVVAQLDFYEYALKGNRTDDVRLQDGDILFIPPVQKRVAIVGAVLRPAIYELKEQETLSDLIALSGGLLVNAYTERIHIERLVPFSQRSILKKDILDIDLPFASLEQLQSSVFKLEDADIVSIYSITNYPYNRVTITGNVNKPGTYELITRMRVSELIMKADSFARNTFMEKATLLRLLPNLRREIYHFNPRKALAGDTTENLVLQNEDQIIIYQESTFFPERYVEIYGAVKNPGRYPRYEKMTVADLVILAGGLREDASYENWELAKIDTGSIDNYSKIFKFSVLVSYWEDQTLKQLLLQDFDRVTVPQNPRFKYPVQVTLAGYFVYPGVYSLISNEERLYDIIKRAGGIRPDAYLRGATMYRVVNSVVM
ncbi:MAG: SLBB domain-containing protein, partial [Bacteroidetes bacterium]|nr:SLBB domain-containing protein [Bacteroidota bacterium]